MGPQPLPTIAEVIRNPGSFAGLFRLCDNQIRTGRSGARFSRAQITDHSGRIICYGWPSALFPIPDLPPMTVVEIAGRSRVFNHEVVVDLTKVSAAPALLTPETALHLIPSSHAATPSYVSRLEQVLAKISTPPLRSFVGRMFANDRIALPFLRAPASVSYHHVEASGLLVHTVEGDELIAGIAGLSSEERDLSLVAYTFHDVGKIKTYEGRDYTTTGRLVSHDDLTLELCAPALDVLERELPDAATTLRHVWTCETPGSRYGFKSASPIVEVVTFADNWSGSKYYERKAFASASPEENLNTVAKRRTWRPRLDVGTGTQR